MMERTLDWTDQTTGTCGREFDGIYSVRHVVSYLPVKDVG